MPTAGLVDTHVHLLPDRLAQAIRRVFRDMGMDRFAYPLDPADVLRQHVADGFSTVWTLPYAHQPGMAARLNADVAALARMVTTDRTLVVPGMTVHPADDDPAADVEAGHDGGARVLKLHCSVGRYTPDDPRLAGALSVAGERNVPVVVHAGHAVSGRTDADELEALSTACARHPDTTFVIAHCAQPATARSLELLARHANAMADLTPVVVDLVDLDPAQLEAHHDRLLLGTDAPNTAVPARRVLDWLDDAGLSADARAAITGGNARRLVPDVTGPPYTSR
ncbi:amidohydrolase family protein [Euzebya rosea]|uniref:amidohydrolase family protein n=1 Tax=Euzebya rosea TaxID=2052804 RepID=UPI000D3E29A6|nr:amidohydrolase family protein [Euzebya rosea]